MFLSSLRVNRIAAATSNFADIYGWRDIGRIEPGRVADVLILEADPSY
jgi:imidazolonepropionase-like amidohydrolase